MDSSRPRKRTSAYMYFCNDVRKTSKNIQIKELSILWNNLKEDPSKKRELDYYFGLADKDSERYDREYEIYKEKNREALNLNRVKRREEINTSKILGRLKLEEQKIQEKIREIEAQLFKKKDYSSDRVSQPRREDFEQSQPRREDFERSQPRREDTRVSSSSSQPRRDDRVSSQPRREDSQQQRKKEIDMNVLLQKIQNERKQTSSKPRNDTPSASEYSSESDNDL